jgi:hypothetical protein
MANPELSQITRVKTADLICNGKTPTFIASVQK